MCMTTESSGFIVEPLRVYKIRRCRDELGLGLFVRLFAPRGRWLTAEWVRDYRADLVDIPEPGWEPGFHSFLSLEDARRWPRGIRFLTIEQVLARGRIFYGHLGGIRMIRTSQILFPETPLTFAPGGHRIPGIR